MMALPPKSPALATARFCRVTSPTAVIVNKGSPLSMWDKLALTGNSPPL
jgi:hypothetical protein